MIYNETKSAEITKLFILDFKIFDIFVVIEIKSFLLEQRKNKIYT